MARYWPISNELHAHSLFDKKTEKNRRGKKLTSILYSFTTSPHPLAICHMNNKFFKYVIDENDSLVSNRRQQLDELQI